VSLPGTFSRYQVWSSYNLASQIIDLLSGLISGKWALAFSTFAIGPSNPAKGGIALDLFAALI
jgi:hypothetical protein